MTSVRYAYVKPILSCVLCLCKVVLGMKLWCLFCMLGVVVARNGGDVYHVGTSKVDITGPVAHNVMFGYAEFMQRSTGLLNRLFARAYVIERDGDKVAIVHCDLHSIPLQLHEMVLERLQEEIGDEFDNDNVVIHGQHTHSAPGGLHSFHLYTITSGFTPLHFQHVLDGIVRSIKATNSQLFERKLYVGGVDILNCSVNRSPDAYNNNPEEERAQYEHNRNTRMSVIKITAAENPDDIVSVMTFFAVHTTSLPKQNTMISSDNKGYAEWLMEKERGQHFTASFFQTDAGDISPNTVDNMDGTFTGVNGDDFIKSAQAIGKCQADSVEGLLGPHESSIWTAVQGSIFARKVYFDFSKYKVDESRKTCPAVSGLNMAAGTEDGRGFFFIHEGHLRTKNNPLLEFLGRAIAPSPLPDQVKMCHEPKTPLFVTGVTDPPMTPQVLPIQAILIGNIGITALPFEVTTMAGRRIRESLVKSIKDRVLQEALVLGVSNAYSGYLTTKEEYQMQHYEGASTHFGPHQLAAVQDMVVRLVSDSKVEQENGKVYTSSQGAHVFTSIGHTLLDSSTMVPFWVRPGDTYLDVTRTQFRKHEVASSQFWCTRPMNSQLLVGSFCNVQKKTRGSWETVYNDHDWNVRFFWRSKYLIFGLCTCQWVIPPDATPQSYRIEMQGLAQEGTAQSEYSGHSSEFQVLALESDTVPNLSPEYHFGFPDLLKLPSLILLVSIVYLFIRRRFRGKENTLKPKSI
uniref:Neutral ceramidase n=1 Tax=Mucochytrium quahogii TaxID=96639 RepID=A0A7S2W7M7_9STRA|mmetsp:Transcript_5193/g.9132  ORF Transcript_5193/g.9132 Transcript_5193/m.9132 type:complete len:742 (-) Transcript_5193:618-2843(-)|eukprot:CAMPEP_0203753440 /NCGR_PEP_ID=MMETSP0098-20131031/7207_1 /ASSEMBLY_ACC=CAM_ASM_000208 /TAXON_ID=96639 /ORGANISM=" , Strain NY0313808BC1" /LENGTH=741 /DNA_ID=CAMNT_0050644037 /DNA_START=1738 /DNA_END=3963 /DNA_ORIENTATION=+